MKIIPADKISHLNTIAKANNIPRKASIAGKDDSKSGKIADKGRVSETQFSVLLSKAEINMLEDLFTVKEIEKKINLDKSIAPSVSGSAGYINNHNDNRNIKRKGTIIDITA